MSPKLGLILLLVLGAAARAPGQGTILWGNNFSGTLRAPVYGSIPHYLTCRLSGNTPTGIPAGTQDYAGAPLLLGTRYTMAIYVGRSEAEVWAALQPLQAVPFRTATAAAGFVSTYTAIDPNRPPGTTGVHVQFRAWDNRGGTITSWAQVMAGGGQTASGQSDVFEIGPLGGTDAFGVDHPPPLTSGIRSFNFPLLGLGPDDFPGCPVRPRLACAKRLDDGAYQFSFTNAGPALFTVLASTNEALPVAQWSVLGVPSSAGGSLYQFTDHDATNHRQRFYLLRSQ